MGEVDFTLMFDMLKDIQTRIGSIETDVSEIKVRLSLMESHTATILAMLATSNNRMDRFEVRLKRIERRLELREEDT